MVMLRRSSSTSTLLFIISFFLLISSTISHHKEITLGSSISSAAVFSTIASFSSSSPFWLSPSGLFAFGFYPLNCNYDEFIIGIWLVKSSQRTLVWSINVDGHSTFHNDVSLHFTNNGKFMVQKKTFEDDEMIIIRKTPIFFHNHDSSSSEYASLLDNGNLVIYDWNDDIIWESFDHPTDTILPGQTLNPGQSLVSSKNNRLSMKENGNLELFKEKKHNVPYLWKSYRMTKNSPVMLRLNSTGHLDLVDTNGYIVKRLNDNHDHDGTIQQNGEGMISATTTMLYRATLDSDGEFRLYKEKIIRSSFGKLMCEKTENSAIILWDTKLKSPELDTLTTFITSLSITLVVGMLVLVTFSKLGLFDQETKKNVVVRRSAKMIE